MFLTVYFEHNLFFFGHKLPFTFLLCCSPSLTSSQPHTRARGVQLLSEVLQECYGVFTEAEGETHFYVTQTLSFMERVSFQGLCLCFFTVEVLITFYENRLKDHYVVTAPVLQGLRALVSLHTLGRPPNNNTAPDGSHSFLQPLFTSCLCWFFPDQE